MRRFINIALLFTCTFTLPLFLHAQVETAQINVGNENYPEAEVAYGMSGDTMTLIASTTPYTIVSFSGYWSFDTGGGVFCGETPLYNQIVNPFERSNEPLIMNVKSEYHCSEDLTVSGGETQFAAVQYVPYDTRTRLTTSKNISITIPLLLIISFILGFDLLRKLFTRHA